MFLQSVCRSIKQNSRLLTLAVILQCCFALLGMNLAASQALVPSEIHANNTSGSPEETQTENESKQLPDHKDEIENLSRASSYKFAPFRRAFQKSRQFAIRLSSVSPPTPSEIVSSSPSNGFSPTSPGAFRNLPLRI